MERALLFAVAVKLRSLTDSFEEAAQRGDCVVARDTLASIGVLESKISFKGWTKLPMQLWLVILPYFTLQDVMKCETSCKTMHNWICQPLFNNSFCRMMDEIRKLRAQYVMMEYPSHQVQGGDDPDTRQTKRQLEDLRKIQVQRYNMADSNLKLNLNQAWLNIKKRNERIATKEKKGYSNLILNATFCII
jgi:hypothetical protein